MSLKRFHGWISTDDEVEWDDTERSWMLALQAYENRLCPLCGMDTSICHDEEKTRALYTGVQVELCFVTQMRERAMEAYESSGSVDTHAQTTKLIPNRVSE